MSISMSSSISVTVIFPVLLAFKHCSGETIISYDIIGALGTIDEWEIIPQL